MENRHKEKQSDGVSYDQGQVNPWRVVGGSGIGTSHLKLGLPCQDAFYYKFLGNDGVAIAVSDGAGSASKADEASAFLVKTAIGLLERKLDDNYPECDREWETTLRYVFENTRQPLCKIAEEADRPVNDYHSTLILVVADEKRCICGLVGDCGAVALGGLNTLLSLCPPQKGEYANITNFITQKTAPDVLDIRIYREKIHAIAVFSDGLMEVAMNIRQNKPYPPFFNPMFNFAAHMDNAQQAEELLVDFLTSKRINKKTDDDKTIVLAVKPETILNTRMNQR